MNDELNPSTLIQAFCTDSKDVTKENFLISKKAVLESLADNDEDGIQINDARYSREEVVSSLEYFTDEIHWALYMQSREMSDLLYGNPEEETLGAAFSDPLRKKRLKTNRNSLIAGTLLVLILLLFTYFLIDAKIRDNRREKAEEAKKELERQQLFDAMHRNLGESIRQGQAIRKMMDNDTASLSDMVSSLQFKNEE